MKKAIALFLLLACGAPQATAPAPSNDAALAAETARLMDLASKQMDRGDHGAAVVTLEMAITHYQKLKKPFDESVAWTMLGQVYIAIGAQDKADAAIARGAALAGTTNDPSTTAVRDMVQKLDVAADFGPSSSFLRSFDKKLDLFPGGTMMFDHFWPFLQELAAVAANPSFSRNRMEDMMALMRGRDLFAAGEFAFAREEWRKGLAKSVNSDLRAGFQAGIGATHLKEDDDEEAIFWFKLAADSTSEPLRHMQSPELMTSYIGSERRWYNDIAIETLLRNQRPAEAFDYSERSRTRALLQMLGNSRLRGGDRSSAEAESLSTSQPLRLDELRKELPADTTLIVYYVSVYGVRAFLMERDALNAVALPFDRASLDRTVAWATSFRATAGRGMAPEVDDTARGTAEEAFDLLIRPLRKGIHNRRLMIVPNGDLHYVPFAALRDRGAGRYLVEDYTISYGPSASVLRFLRTKESPIDGGSLILGNPDSGLAALPGSAREATTVARILGTNALLGARATEDALYRLGGHTDLLHIAAHARYEPAQPLHSYVALAQNPTRDGKLEVLEILSDLDLTGVNLVVLSACRTAAGKPGGGDDIVGLTRAILYAGSPAVISTLWDIDDEAAASLMEEFYRRLRAGASTADALRSAQLAMLHGQAYEDPAFWAAFTLTGDPLGRWSA